MKKNTINNMSLTKRSTRREGGGVNLRTGKLKRIKTQVMSRHPWHSGLARGPRVAETWIRLPASAVFLFVPLPPFFYAAIAKCWKVQRSNG